MNLDCTQLEVTEELGELKYTYVPGNCESVENTGSSWKVNVNCKGSCKYSRVDLVTACPLNVVLVSSLKLNQTPKKGIFLLPLSVEKNKQFIGGILFDCCNCFAYGYL